MLVGAELTRADWLVAVVRGGWMIAFDAWQGPLSVVFGVLLVPVTVLLRLKPGWAAAGVLAVFVTEWVLGDPVQTTGVACRRRQLLWAAPLIPNTEL